MVGVVLVDLALYWFDQLWGVSNVPCLSSGVAVEVRAGGSVVVTIAIVIIGIGIAIVIATNDTFRQGRLHSVILIIKTHSTT